MRYLAYLLALILLGAAALAGQELALALEDPLPPALAPSVPQGETPDQIAAAETGAPRDWPLLFGKFQPPEPQPPKPPAPEPEPQPPAPPAPPLNSLGFSLQGVVSDGETRWAIVSHPTGQRLLKVGDALNDSYTISRIDVEGLWAKSAPNAEEQLLGFPEQR